MRKSLIILSVLFTLGACESMEQDPAPVLNNDGTSNINTQGSYNDDFITTEDLGYLGEGTQEVLVSSVGDRVFFTFNSSDLTANAQRTLARQADWLKDNPNVNITIEGHADERGTREYNLALGEQRATSVKNFLTKNGVSPSRVTTISYGKEHPEFLGSNEAAWSKNRRAVSVVD